MSAARWLRSVATLLTREQWAMVLVLAGASLLVAPPDRPGAALVAWVALVLAASFVVVLVGSRVWPRIRA